MRSRSGKAAANGNLELKQLSVLTDAEGLTGGTIELEVRGHSCTLTPTVVQKKPHFWQRRLLERLRSRVWRRCSLIPECWWRATWWLGSAKLHGAGYENEDGTWLHDVDGGADLHITPSEFLLTNASANLPGGGNAMGELRIVELAGRFGPTWRSRRRRRPRWLR